MDRHLFEPAQANYPLSLRPPDVGRPRMVIEPVPLNPIERSPAIWAGWQAEHAQSKRLHAHT